MQRHIVISGGYNVRDLGGYRTNDGGTLKWRKLYRSGILTHLTEEGIAQTAELNIKTICDFRATEERKAAPDKWYKIDDLNSISLPVGEGRPDQFPWLEEQNLVEGKGHHLYKANRSYVKKNAHRFKAFFEVLLDESNYPLLYHCTAGKDRTGFASMLLLSALGVDWDIIIEDYLLTNKYLKEFAERMSANIAKSTGVDQNKIITIFQAKEEFLKGAMDLIEQDYGTVQLYLKDEMGIKEQEEQELKRILVDYKS